MSNIQESFKEVKEVMDPLMERALLIQVATAIHAAAIASDAASGDVFESVNEAADLITACDDFLKAEAEATE